jgi:pimeloyl-ACP methyl ester carboxylesterase
MPTLDRPTVTLNYQEAGSGPPVVFLHGWCDGSASWAATMAAFAAAHHCVAPDMRGHGESGMPRDHCFTSEALSNDVVAICSAAGITSPVLVGHSYGGFIAAEVARRFPGFARAVVVEDQPLNLRPFTAQMRAVEFLIRSPDTHMAFRDQLFEGMVTEAMPEADRAIIAGLKSKTPVDVGQALWSALFEFTEDEIAARSDELLDALGNQPTLVVDSAPSAEYHAEVLRRAPGVKLAVIRSGHWVHLERPAEFRAALQEFIAELP